MTCGQIDACQNCRRAILLALGIGAGNLASLDSLKSFLDLPLRSMQIERCPLEVTVRAGERQALSDQLLAGGGKMRVGLAGCGKCRVPKLLSLIHI